MKARLRGAARLGVAGVSLFFIFAAAAKAQTLEDFGATIAAHGLIAFPERAAYGVVIAELGVGLFGLAGVAVASSYRRPAFALAGLATLFAAYSLALTLRPPPVPTGCGCGFSKAPIDSWAPIAMRNSSLAGVLIIIGATGPGRAARPGEGTGNGEGERPTVSDRSRASSPGPPPPAPA